MKKVFFIVSLMFVSSFVNAQTGIGTTTPINKFEVVAITADPASSGSSANGNVRLGPSSGSHVLDFGLSSTSTYAWLQARLKSNYGTNYNLVLNPNGGQVGIGTTAPSSTLTVGNTDGTVGGEILLNPTSTQYEGGQIIFKRSKVGSTVDWTIDQYGSTSANARLRIFNGNSEINGLSILENGNIGIGTAIPTSKLNIDGGGIRISTGFNNSTNRPGLNAGSIGNYEIRGVGAGGSGSAQNDGGDDGFLRLSAGGGTSTSAQSSIDISGFSNVADLTNTIVMRTAGTERLRINSNGNVGIGINSPSRKLHILNSDNTTVYIESSTNDNNGMMILNANTDQNWNSNWHEFLMFQKQGNTIGQVVAANSGAGVTYNTTSDYRLKTDLKDFNGIDLVNKIKTYDFAWKSNNSRMHGVMAHELQEVLPYAVTGKKDSVDATGKMITQGVDYGRITPILVKAIQEQDRKISQLSKEKIELQEMILDMQRRLLILENKNK
jgi:hypothetical protein